VEEHGISSQTSVRSSSRSPSIVVAERSETRSPAEDMAEPEPWEESALIVELSSAKMPEVDPASWPSVGE
jgi:hypothetical protein